jgi:hypothetical protein
MPVPAYRLQKIADDLCIRRWLKRLQRVSRESAADCCDNHATGRDARTPVHRTGPSFTTLARTQAGLTFAASETQPATNEWMIGTQAGARNNEFVMRTPACAKRGIATQFADCEDPFSSRSLYPTSCARSLRTKRFALRSNGECALPLPAPVGAAGSKTPKSHHACAAERADEITYSGNQA